MAWSVISQPKISKYFDAVYVAKYFDLLMWWKQEGSILFADFSCEALVMLGKPKHIAFQERGLVEVHHVLKTKRRYI
jgi:hypothetical protein